MAKADIDAPEKEGAEHLKSTHKALDKTGDEDGFPNARARKGVDDKTVEENVEAINQGSSEKKVSSLADALKIPVEEKSSVGGEEESADDVLEGERVLSSDDDGPELDSELFEDHELMADIGVELIDIVITTSAKAIGGGDESDYSVSQARRNKLKKPLGMLLKQREVGVSPEVMVIVMVGVIYSPVVIKAFSDRKKKKQEEAKKKKDPKAAIMEEAINARRNTQTVADRPGPSNYSDGKGKVFSMGAQRVQEKPETSNPKAQRKKRVKWKSPSHRMEVARKMEADHSKGLGYGKLSDKYGVSATAVRSMLEDVKKEVKK